MKGIKTIEERLQQSVRLLMSMKDVGLNFENEGVKQFKILLNRYVRENLCFSGKIFIKEENLYLHYILTNDKDCQAVLSNSPKRRF